VWNNASGGPWSDPLNWAPNNVPDAPGESAAIAIGGTYTVTLDISPTIEWLDISNPGATLHLPTVTLTLLRPAGLTNFGTVRGYSNGTIVGNISNDGLISVRGYNQVLRLDGPTVVNDGMMIVNPEHSGYTAELRFGANTTLGGSGVLQLDWGTAYLSTLTGVTVTQGAGHTVAGRGKLRAALINDGTVRADIDGATMVLEQEPKVNNGVMKAAGGGTLSVEAVPVDQTGGGTLLAEDGSFVHLVDASIGGGRLESAGSGYIEHRGGTCTLTGVTNDGLLNLRGFNLSTYVDGAGLTNNGRVVVNWDDAGHSAQLYFIQSGALDGTGTVTLNNGSAYLVSAADATIAHGASHTIEGEGHLSAAMTNDGIVNANRTGRVLHVDGHPKANNSTMKASAGSQMRVLGTTVDQSGGGTLLAENASSVVLDDCTIIGGTLHSLGSGHVERRVGQGTLRGVTNTGLLDLRGYNLYTFVTGSGLTNDGLIVVNWDHAGYFASLHFAENGTLDGSGLLRLDHASAWLESSEDVTIIHGPSHTIDGWGEIRAAIDNYGVIDANEPGQQLIASTYIKRNNSLMRATDGGILRVSGTTIDQTGGGTLLAADGSKVGLYAGTILGGTLDSEGDGYIEHDGSGCTLTGVTNNSLLRLRGYNLTTGVRGGRLTNNGQIEVNWDSAGYLSTLDFLETGVLDGSGTVTLHNGTAYVHTAGGVTMTHGPAHTIRGWGGIQAAMDNQGLIDADSAGHELIAYGEPKQNRALMRATGGGILSISGTTIDQTGGGTLLAADGSKVGLYAGTILGGTLDSEGAGYVEHEGSGCTLSGVTNNGLLRLRGYNLTTGVRGGRLSNNGQIVVNWDGSGYHSTLEFLESGVLDGAGTLILNTGTSHLQAAGDVTCTIGPEQTVGGIGTMNGTFVTHGTLAPGQPVGSMTVHAGALSYGPAARLDLELAGTGGDQYDRLVGNAAHDLDGALLVTLLGRYVPVFGDSFVIISGGAVSGRFAQIAAPSLPDILVWKVRYEPARAVLVVTCLADFNADTVVDTRDVIAFLNAWTTKDPEADIDGNGSVDTRDVIAFLNLWTAGC